MQSPLEVVKKSELLMPNINPPCKFLWSPSPQMLSVVGEEFNTGESYLHKI